MVIFFPFDKSVLPAVNEYTLYFRACARGQYATRYLQTQAGWQHGVLQRQAFAAAASLLRLQKLPLVFQGEWWEHMTRS